MIQPEELKALLLRAFPDAEIELTDLTGTQDHYQARVVSAAFSGKTPIEQHRLVYDSLGDAMRGPVHALALKTFTPAAWARTQGGAAAPEAWEGTAPPAGAGSLRASEASAASAGRRR